MGEKARDYYPSFWRFIGCSSKNTLSWIMGGPKRRAASLCKFVDVWHLTQLTDWQQTVNPNTKPMSGSQTKRWTIDSSATCGQTIPKSVKKSPCTPGTTDS